MVDLDLDILAKRKRTIKIAGEEHTFRDITMEEHLEAELIVQQLEATPLIDKRSIKKATTLKNEYLMKILDIDEKIAATFSLKQYQALRTFINRQEMYDQGFTDRDIDLIEKQALKKQMAQIQ